MADPTQTVINQTSIPDYARPYVETMLGKAEALTRDNPYQAYPEQRSAYFTDLQNKAFAGAQNLGPASQLNDATSMAQKAGLGALGMNYQAGKFGVDNVNAPSLQNYQMGPAQQVYTQSFAQPGAANAYMNPYMQNVVDIQQREAQRQADIAGTQRNAQATSTGAFGGSRQAVMNAEAARNLATQKGDIQATGLNAAYNQAMQQFNNEQQARLSAQQANQQAGLTTGQANLNAMLGVQNLGANQSLQAQLANQQTGMQAQQMGEQSRQFGSNLGLQGYQTGLQAAGALGNIGSTQFSQELGALGLQNQFGTQQQQDKQNQLNQQYQDFLNQKQYPYQQLSYMSDMLRGMPLTQSSQQSYTAQPSTLSQVAGLGTTAAGLIGAYNKSTGAAAGGSTKDIQKRRPAGLAELALSKMG